MKSPFFSIIIPAHNRSDIIEMSLLSLKKQTFSNFEVILSDNTFEYEDARKVFDKYSDERFRYIKPPKELCMIDNWEYPLCLATGKYIGYIEDKMFLYEDALSKIYDCIMNADFPDSVGWYIDICSMHAKENANEIYVFRKERISGYNEFDSKELIDRKLGFYKYGDELFQTPGPGSVQCGVVRRDIIQKMISKFKRYFFLASPDFGTGFLTLLESSRHIEMQDNMTLCLTREDGNGMLCSVHYSKIKEFPNVYWNYALVPGYDATNVNLVAGDYHYALSLYPKLKGIHCKKLNTLIAIGRHKEMYDFSDCPPPEKERIFQEALSRLSPDERNKYDEIVKRYPILEGKGPLKYTYENKRMTIDRIEDFRQAIYYRFHWIDNENVLELCKGKTVCCYGAGKYGKLVLGYLRKHGVEVAGFFVSDISNQPKTVQNVPVYDVGNAPFHKDEILIILSLNMRFHAEVTQLLHAHEYYHIYDKINYLDL